MFSKKSIRVDILKVDGNFYDDKNIISFVNLPVEVNINIVTLPAGMTARIKIYGVSKENLDRITTLKWKDAFISKKSVRVIVNDGKGENILYEGNIMGANPVYDSAPEVYIDIEAVAGAFFNMISDIPPSHLEGKVPASEFIRQICRDYKFDCKVHGEKEDYGQCIDPTQSEVGLGPRINAASRAYNIYPLFFNNKVEIYPKYGFYGKKFNFSPQNYIGYPSFTATGLKIRTDEICDINLKDVFFISNSQVSAANDSWFVIRVSYNLSTKIGGKWLMEIEGVRTIDDRNKE